MNSHASYLHTGALNYQVSGLIAYINDHLEEDLSIPLLSRECCLSPYHMMRLFKEETGCTIGSYITQKRLSLARETDGLRPERHQCLLWGRIFQLLFLPAGL